MNTIKNFEKLNKPQILSFNEAGIGSVDVSDPSKPLEVLVGPLDMSEKDRINLFWGSNEEYVATYTHSAGMPDTNGIFSLYVDTRWITPGITEVKYEYIPYPSNTAQTSDITTVLVKLTLPGGIDTNPATPYENERLAKPKVSPEGVITSPEGVSVDITPYMNMSVGDKITLSWHGELIRTEITDQAQVGKPVVIPVSKEIIEQAGDSDRLEVRYEIRDIVNNWSRWSLPVYLEVEAGDSSLPAPVTPQAPEMELDLDRLAQADVQVLVIAHPDIQRGDELVLTVERNTPEGEPLESYVASQTITTSSSFYEFQVPNAQFQPIAQGRARLQYRVYQQAGNALRSKSLTLNIVGSPMELALPRVPAAEQNEGVLDPSSRNVIAEVPAYYFMSEGNDVHLFWMGKTQSGANVMHDELKTIATGDVGSQVDFSIPDEKIAVLAGGSVEIYYTVNTFNRAFFKSPSLMLRVSDDRDMPLPLPTILEADNDTLDPADTLNGATVVIGTSANLRVGDQVKVSWKGAKGSDEKEKVIAADSAGKVLSVVFSSALVSVNEGERISVNYTVTRANGTVQTSEVFSVQVKTTLRELPAPTMDTVGPDGVVKPGLIAETGATVRVDFDDLSSGDKVKVIWVGASRYETPEQTAGGSTALVFNLPKALILATLNANAAVTYQVTRAGATRESLKLKLSVLSTLTFNTSPLTLSGKAYVLTSRPDVTHKWMPDNSAQRVAKEGVRPYTYRSSNPAIAQVQGDGVVWSRGNGKATISVTDATGASLSYPITVSGVIQCVSLPKGKFDEVSAAAASQHVRLPSIQELREIHAAYNSRWPLDKLDHWSSTVAKPITPFGKTYYVKNPHTGREIDAYTYSHLPAVGLR